MQIFHKWKPTTSILPNEQRTQPEEPLQIREPLTTSKIAGKRIVSKSEYVLRRAFQGGLAFSCTCAVGIAILSGLSAIIALIIAACTIVYAFQHHYLQEDLPDILNCLVRVLVLGGISGLSWWLALMAVKKSKENIVVPLTRANTADLPAADSLVRASAEPLQAQQTVLLRAAMETTEGQEEQLLRAAAGEQE